MIFSAFLLVNCTVWGQVIQDTLEYTPDTSEASQPSVPGEQSPILSENTPGADDPYIKIQREEVPLFLQRILQDEKFRGWESGGVYRNDSGSMYKVEVRDGMNNRDYYFDKEGSLLRAE